MPVQWKFSEFLDTHKLTVYSLAKELDQQVSITTLYSLKNKQQKRIDLDTLNALLPALERVTGQRVELSDLLDYERS